MLINYCIRCDTAHTWTAAKTMPEKWPSCIFLFQFQGMYMRACMKTLPCAMPGMQLSHVKMCMRLDHLAVAVSWHIFVTPISACVFSTSVCVGLAQCGCEQIAPPLADFASHLCVGFWSGCSCNAIYKYLTKLRKQCLAFCRNIVGNIVRSAISVNRSYQCSAAPHYISNMQAIGNAYFYAFFE